jgi:hypothetical protein
MFTLGCPKCHRYLETTTNLSPVQFWGGFGNQKCTFSAVQNREEGDPVVTHASSKDAYQWHPSQRLHPEFFYIRDVKYVGKSTLGPGIMVLQEGDDTPICVSWPSIPVPVLMRMSSFDRNIGRRVQQIA